MSTARTAVRWVGTATAALLAGAAPVAAAATHSTPTPGPGYTLTPWATGRTSGCTASSNNGSPTCYYNPDSVTHDASYVFVGYQNSAAADGSSGSSEVVQYPNTAAGTAPVAYYHVPGKNDGLRVDPATGDVWALSNEDANPILTIIHPTTMGGTSTTYRLPPPAKLPGFAGGYDDIAFTAGRTFFSASNPALDAQGNNNFPAIVRAQVNGSSVALTPVLTGRPIGKQRATGQTVAVNLTDPDSLGVTPDGSLVLNDQADSILVFVGHPGTTRQAISFTFLQPSGNAPIVDETTWARASSGHFLVVDHTTPGVVYLLTRTGGFVPNTAYTTVSTDNPIASQAASVSVLNPVTGRVAPVVTGLTSPKGLDFIG